MIPPSDWGYVFYVQYRVLGCSEAVRAGPYETWEMALALDHYNDIRTYEGISDCLLVVDRRDLPDSDLTDAMISSQRPYPCLRCGQEMRDLEEADAHESGCRGDGLPGLDEIPVLGEEEGAEPKM